MSDQTELVMRWTSHQQTNWVITIKAENARWQQIAYASHDGAREQKLEIIEDQTTLRIESDTSWDTASCIVDMEYDAGAKLHVKLRDPYAEDRIVQSTVTLAELEQAKRMDMDSVEWPVKECYLLISTEARDIEQEKTVLKELGHDRRKNIEALLALADKSEHPRRVELLLRAAAACTGACNHGPLEPDGWDRAIAIYKKVIAENPNTDTARDAQWAIAGCFACWSPEAGCDRDGRGKGQWFDALKAYQELYETSDNPSEKADALRRMAEIRCFEIGEIDEGLENYLKIAIDYADRLPISPRWTYRTCAPHVGCEKLAWDMYRALTYRSNDIEQAKRIHKRIFGNTIGNKHVDELTGLVNLLN